MQPKPERHERQDWAIVLILLLIGFLCVIVAGQWALRLSPSWKLNTDMGSNLDPNSDFLTDKPVDFIVPLDPDILTKPAWDGLFTPGVKFVTRTPLPPPPLSVSTAAVTETGLPATSLVGTSTVAVTNTSTLAPTNTFVWLPLPATATKKPKPADPPPDTPVNTPTPGATLLITNTDDATEYVPGTPRTYRITISNTVAGSSNVVGATVTDIFPPEMLTHDWTCTVAGTPGAACTAGGSGDINDLVNLPFNSSVTYTVNVTTDPGAPVNLSNMASVSLPTGYLGPTPIDATDTDTLITTSLTPGQAQLPHDLPTYNLTSGSTITLNTSINVSGNPSWDLIYYELPTAGGIDMDLVIIQISDGYNWYTVLNWGGGGADTNTSINIANPLFGGSETDNRHIDSGFLYDTTGVGIELDGVVPPGTYSYIRISAPAGDGGGDGCDIDALVPLP